jgi:hypothetical protein
MSTTAENPSDGPMQHLFEQFEADFNAGRLEKAGVLAVTAARITGLVYLEAIGAGVPHSIAQDMAVDFWANQMGTPVLVTEDDDE